MTQYIDKDALVAEIQKRIKETESMQPKFDQFWAGQISAFKGVLKILDTLEVKEVDLDFQMFAKEMDIVFALPSSETKNTEEEPLNWEYAIAKHFFELGLKAQKIQDEIKIGETEIYLEDDGGEPPYDGIQWLDLSCMEYEIPKDKFKDGDNVEIIIRKAQKGE